MHTRGEHFQFGPVFTLKNNQTNFFFLKKIKTETDSNQPVSVQFGSVNWREKPEKTTFY
jgi:hypothetical protein